MAIDQTSRLIEHVRSIRYDSLSPEVVAMARLCLLDWIGVTVAGATEPLVEILVADALADGGGTSLVVGRPEQVRPLDAVMINGAAGHALDYDDGNPAMLGHPTAPLAPPVLELGASLGASGADVLVALVAGAEASAFTGRYLGQQHYRQGFHGTATTGAIGAAVAAGVLLGLDADQLTRAVGLAATRAAGLRISFGTMAKPLHAGHAAWVGLSSARLAARGFTGSDEALGPRGMAAVLGGTGAEPELGQGFAIAQNRFKWHASCYMTHGSIEALGTMRRQHELEPQMVDRVTLRVPPHAEGVCNIAEPDEGLAIKFSLRMTAALVLSGIETSDPASFSDANARDPQLRDVRDRIDVVLDPAVRAGAEVRVQLVDGRVLEAGLDPDTIVLPLADLSERLERKFMALAAPRLGEARADEVRRIVRSLERLPDTRGLTSLLAVNCADG